MTEKRRQLELAQVSSEAEMFEDTLVKLLTSVVVLKKGLREDREAS